MIIRVIDTETTGLEPDAGVVEIGWTDLAQSSRGAWDVDETHSVLVDPQKPIDLEAQAVHHITEAEIAASGALPLAETLERHRILNPGADLYAAFKADFDGQFIPFNRDVICVWKLVLRLAPRARKHSNQFIRYLLRLELDAVRASPPHRAGPDTYVTAHILKRALEKRGVDECLQISREPAILPRLGFGEHATKFLDERDEATGEWAVPTSYLEWIKRTGFEDRPEIRATALHHIEVRRAIARQPMRIIENNDAPSA